MQPIDPFILSDAGSCSVIVSERSVVYLPAHFHQDPIRVLHELLAASSLATLVSMTADGLIASHAPMMLDPDPAPYGTLIGHLAKANPHACAADPAVPTLVIIQGPDGYITPSYYAAKQEHGKVVPTWNYTVVHAYGPLQAFDDPVRLLDIVTRLTDRHENPRAQPWAVSDAPGNFIQGMLRGIVGIRVPITRLEAKVKMSQNRPVADQAGVVDGLLRDGHADLATAVLRATGN